MTVRKMIPIEDAARRLNLLQRCVDDSPDGEHTNARDVHLVIGQIADFANAQITALGLNVDHSDAIFEIEAAIYGMILDKNPQAQFLIAAEAFGAELESRETLRNAAQTASGLRYHQDTARIRADLDRREPLEFDLNFPAPNYDQEVEAKGGTRLGNMLAEAAMLQAGIVPETMQDDAQITAIVLADTTFKRLAEATRLTSAVRFDTLTWLHRIERTEADTLSPEDTDAFIEVIEREPVEIMTKLLQFTISGSLGTGLAKTERMMGLTTKLSRMLMGF